MRLRQAWYIYTTYHQKKWKVSSFIQQHSHLGPPRAFSKNVFETSLPDTIRFYLANITTYANKLRETPSPDIAEARRIVELTIDSAILIDDCVYSIVRYKPFAKDSEWLPPKPRSEWLDREGDGTLDH